MTTRATRYVAFLRGMNVGGHRVTMSELREQFGVLGFTQVESFIASGNLIFSAPGHTTRAPLERTIEVHLRQCLGYPVATFLRTPAELEEIVANVPFGATEIALAGYTVHVGFLRAAPDDALRALLAANETSFDAFGTGTREIYWLCRGKLTESTVKWSAIERTIDGAVTMRNLTTVRKLVQRYRG
jgi:uncharacterized protein (DUF1697 family)